jgi:hypothetical protein
MDVVILPKHQYRIQKKDMHSTSSSVMCVISLSRYTVLGFLFFLQSYNLEVKELVRALSIFRSRIDLIIGSVFLKDLGQEHHPGCRRWY